ncbi:hypothetical protein NFI96_020505 [Prochilodus magdalenae]|nr:hypothetical protein NFI96_020505 [Prochilodus magdalenae]
MNIRMAESCVPTSRCGAYYTLWLNGSHPEIEDGVVTRQVCGNAGSDCCLFGSTSIKVKTCPGNYSVYKFIRPNYCNMAYCTDVNTITPNPQFNTSTTKRFRNNPTHRNLSSSATTPTNPNFDPCTKYSVVYDDWRIPGITFNYYGAHDDTVVEWKGWYRLYIEGKSAQIAETVWCERYRTCGGYTAVWLGGSHPRLEDGIVTREIYRSARYYNDYYDTQCSFTRSGSVHVKACPEDYYVYTLVKPDVSSPMPTYCAVVLNILTHDPCHNYLSLDQPWRANNETGLGICDRDFSWNGWYRLFYYGMNIRMPESYVDVNRCGSYYGLWLNGPHPETEDGVVTRQVCGNGGRNSCYFRSTPIRVKACPGSYYVYEFVSPHWCQMAYCTEMSALYFTVCVADPCYNYVSLDQPWRANNETGLEISDTDFSWNGWYRLFYYGMNIRMSESCVSTYRCGTYNTVWLNGSHPQIEDGVVTRQVCGNDGRDCCNIRLNPIRVKACPGSYYVYELVSTFFYNTAYCTDADTVTPTAAPTTTATDAGLRITRTTTPMAYSFDPCHTYTFLDDEWRNVSYRYWYWNPNKRGHDDTTVEWNGWYRLFFQGADAQIFEGCVSYMQCGGYTSLWLDGSHPQIEDGIVTRDVYASRIDDYYGYQCSNYRKSNPIQVKACPGDYYVYKLVKPDVSLPMPTYCTVKSPKLSYDPCYYYDVLDDPQRATNQTINWNYYWGWSWCDTNMKWSGWYRLLYEGNNILMPESCVSEGMCGTDVPLWLNGSHPRLEDGIVTRRVCGSWSGDCCYFRSFPIRVKACPGNYYVYEFVSPNYCSSAYCADVNTITPVNDPEIPVTTDSMTTTSTVTVDPCAEQSCTEDEWCGVRDGVYGCFCNQSDPRPKDKSYDSRETCESSSGTMSLSRCQLFEAGFPTNVLHLSDPSCNGTLQNGRLVFHFDNDEHICGTNLTANGTHFIYENSIQGVADSAGGAINRKKELELRFSCVYKLRQTLTMDMEFSPLQRGTEDIEVDQRIFMEVAVQGVDGRQIATVIDSCWVTPVNDQNYAVRWDLIINRCPNPGDNTVKVLQNGVSTAAHFFFKMLAFNGNYSKVFLHCGIHLCLLQNSNCAAGLNKDLKDRLATCDHQNTLEDLYKLAIKLDIKVRIRECIALPAANTPPILFLSSLRPQS